MPYPSLAIQLIPRQGLVMTAAIDSGLKADLRRRELRWLLAGASLIALFAALGGLAFSIAKDALERVLSVLAGLIGLGFFFLFRWSSRRQSRQILGFAEQLGPELREAGFTSRAGFVFIFRNGVYFQWHYGSRVNSFIGFRLVFAFSGYPVVPSIDAVGRWTSEFFWGKELIRVRENAGPEPLRRRLQTIGTATGYGRGWISVREARARESGRPDQSRWFVSCGFFSWNFWQKGAAVASQLEALRKMLEEARTAAVAAHQ